LNGLNISELYLVTETSRTKSSSYSFKTTTSERWGNTTRSNLLPFFIPRVQQHFAEIFVWHLEILQ